MKLMSKKIGRVLSALLATAMIITSLPQSLLTVRAAESGGNPPPAIGFCS